MEACSSYELGTGMGTLEYEVYSRNSWLQFMKKNQVRVKKAIYITFILMQVLAVVLGFGYDMWCGKTPLREVFPTLYECSMARYALVESILVRRSEGDLQSWDVNFLRDFNDQELKSVASFVNLFYLNIPKDWVVIE